MDSVRLTERLHNGWLAVSQRICITTLSCGALLGALTVSTWLSWTLTWSDDRALTCAAILMFAGGLAVGGRWSLSRFVGRAELAVAACTWTLLQPWLIAVVTLSMRFVPLPLLASEYPRLLVGLACATPTWFIAGWLWSSLAVGAAESADARRWSPAALAAGLAYGIAFGFAISAFVLAPLLGAWGTIACAAVVLVVSRLMAGSDQTAGDSFADASGWSESPETNRQFLASNSIAFHAFKTLAAVAIGGLLAVILRLMGQLMPGGAQVCCAEWMGLAIGFGIGQSLFCLRRYPISQGPAPLLIPAASGALLLLIMPFIVDASLWATASLTWVILLMSFRVLLLVVATAPVGFALAGLVPVTRVPFSRLFFSLPVSLGLVAALFCFESVGAVGILTACTSTLVLLGLASLRMPGRDRPSRLGIVAVAGCALLGLSVPAWRANDNPARTAKLLFSTPAFVAHRAGWDSNLLPMLDDARVIDLRDGVHGPLTLWRYHGVELHLRENGIPRSVISADTEAHPQFAPEVLQVIFPMVMSRNPNHILLLGASAGVPLSTCLNFAVQEVVCAEGDPDLMNVIRGPIANETGFDPFADERVRLVTIPPAIALMNSTESYDVILSSPASASTVAGAAFFTVDHYQRASSRLAAGGIFCQRFECVDYGPDPLRIVVQSMRQAFYEVIAIETAAGEFLLFGTNTPGAFVNDDLARRLEAPNVRRLLARSGLDWSALLNFPAYDHAALAEICDEARASSNSNANGILALRAPLELMRWGAKLQEVQHVLTADRTSPAPFARPDGESTSPADEVQLARKSRMLEWLGDRRVTPDLLRRLSEVATQHKLVLENPEWHWWKYRTALREQLQKRARSAIQMVNHTTDGGELHPEDQRRKQYFVALGAVLQAKPTPAHIATLSSFLQPYDPLISYFAHQEIADAQARGQIDPAAELVSRLHVIYFAPAADASTSNVSTALELLVQHPDAIPDPVRRFDTLNGLVQTLRSRWQGRQSYAVKYPRLQLSDVDRSLVAIEKAVRAMGDLHSDAKLSDADWQNRKQVIERILLRPLRAYHSELQSTAKRSESRTRPTVANPAADDAGTEKAQTPSDPQ